ncbi:MULTISPECIES: DUF6048 family protein [Chryseobacterium]|uniref:Outer membrane protein beta-barrel domain-containing protein n=1 Tax=Chryseobacterium taihuense TaxID=1141221 RepID=A0A1G9P383_9FLAO|nr:MULTISPECIES: DUF6048 family protein [Chryseobacterium]QQV01963.1 hypothetical protein I6I61_12880 [Chryseobacterium sp. FDAARGOS 1104]SDL93154.1 hypothetical protein SAMN05216273_1094 [Chryseobacterium taihuense]VFB04812.1 Uncharacterised protein [Chryseobacterium taihuense]
MKKRPIYILIFSILGIFNAFGQEKEESAKVKWKYEPNFMVGVDVLNAGVAFFSDRQLFQGFISSKVKDNLHGVIEAGFEKNIYQNNGYDAKVNGPFMKIGAFYMLARDRENDFNGFYGGGKIGGSFYNQEYMAIPVRGFGGNSSSVSMPSSSQSSFWLEANLGGRVQLFETNFYIDVNMQPRYLVYTTKQDDVVPMIVPGFGRSSSKFNMGFAWNIAYKF